MAAKIEQKKVTYEHEMDGKNATQRPLSRNVSVQPNASLTEAVDAVGNPDRLKVQYNVGKNPETKSIQSIK